MDDLISRQAAIDVIKGGAELIRRSLDNLYVVGSERSKFAWGLGLLESCIDEVNELPSAQPERKKGKWEQVEVSYFKDMDAEINESMAIASMFCPRCKRYHNEVYLYGDPTFGVNYCPNCGADMRGKE